MPLLHGLFDLLPLVFSFYLDQLLSPLRLLDRHLFLLLEWGLSKILRLQLCTDVHHIVLRLEPCRLHLLNGTDFLLLEVSYSVRPLWFFRFAHNL